MPKKILLIEDVKMNRELASKTLELNGYEVISCENGLCGLDRAKNENPDLVITDLGLGDISGEKIVAELKSLYEGKNIPIVVLSAAVEMKKRFKPGTLTAFLEKPISPKILIAVVEKLLKE